MARVIIYDETTKIIKSDNKSAHSPTYDGQPGVLVDPPNIPVGPLVNQYKYISPDFVALSQTEKDDLVDWISRFDVSLLVQQIIVAASNSRAVELSPYLFLFTHFFGRSAVSGLKTYVDQLVSDSVLTTQERTFITNKILEQKVDLDA